MSDTTTSAAAGTSLRRQDLDALRQKWALSGPGGNMTVARTDINALLDHIEAQRRETAKEISELHREHGRELRDACAEAAAEARSEGRNW